MRILSTVLFFIGVSAAFANTKVTINGIAPNINANSCLTYSNLYKAYMISLDSLEKVKQNISDYPVNSKERKKWENLLPFMEANTEGLQESLMEFKDLEIFSAQITLSQLTSIPKDRLSDSGGLVVISPVKSESDEEINVGGVVQIIAYGPRACGDLEAAEGDINKAIRQNILNIFSIE